MATRVISGRTNEGRETVFIATCGVARQSTVAAQRLYEQCRAARVTCIDCGEAFPAGALDGSTILCEVCYEVAGLENELQDGYIDEAEFERRVKAVRG